MPWFWFDLTIQMVGRSTYFMQIAFKCDSYPLLCFFTVYQTQFLYHHPILSWYGNQCLLLLQYPLGLRPYRMIQTGCTTKSVLLSMLTTKYSDVQTKSQLYSSHFHSLNTFFLWSNWIHVLTMVHYRPKIHDKSVLSLHWDSLQNETDICSCSIKRVCHWSHMLLSFSFIHTASFYITNIYHDYVGPCLACISGVPSLYLLPRSHMP